MSLSSRIKKNSASNINNVMIRRTAPQSAVPMLTQKIAPAGWYTSKIVAVDTAKTESLDDAVDIVYELTDDDGKVVQGRLRYAVDGYHFGKLCDALVDAGVPDGSPIMDAVGVEEELEIVYLRRGDLAKIKNRRPRSAAHAAPKKATARRMVAEDTDEVDEDIDDDILLEDD